MSKQIEVHGYIEYPDAAELPDIGQIVTVGEFSGEITGDGRKKRKHGDRAELVSTAKLVMGEGAQVLKVEDPATPLFEEADEE